MRPPVIILSCLLVACNAAPPSAPGNSISEAPAVDVSGHEPTVSPPETGEIRWTYVDNAAALHAAHLDALRTFDGGAPAAEALIPHADALENLGASWGLGESGKVLLVPFASGPRVRMGSGDPHAIVETPRYHDPEPWQTRAWRMLADGDDVVENNPGFRYEFMGALRNEAACSGCHNQQPAGALLGAWYYSLNEIADD